MIYGWSGAAADEISRAVAARAARRNEGADVADAIFYTLHAYHIFQSFCRIICRDDKF